MRATKSNVLACTRSHLEKLTIKPRWSVSLNSHDVHAAHARAVGNEMFQSFGSSPL